MNKKLATASSVLLLLLIFPLVGSALAQTQAVAGVSVGNRFTYDSTYFWNSTSPIDLVPAYLKEQNQSTLQVTVEVVTGSTVQLQRIWRYQNGPQDNSTEYDEVNSGLTGTVLVYAANLTAGGLLFPGSTELPYRVNDTSIRSYLGGYRETNHIEVNNTGAEGVVYSYMNLYFDKQTGILVEYYLTTVYTATPSQTTTQHLVLKDSNAWAVSGSPSNSPTSTTTSSPAPNPTETPSATSPTTSTEVPMDLIAVIIVVAAVVVVVVVLLLMKKKPKQESQQETSPETTSEAS